MNQTAISFNCPACQTILSVPVEMAGVSGPCPYCGVEVRSPELPVSATVPLEAPGFPPDPPVAREEPAAQALPSPVQTPAEPAAITGDPAPAQRSGRGALVATVLVAGMAAGGWFAWQEWQKRTGTSSGGAGVSPAPSRPAPPAGQPTVAVPKEPGESHAGRADGVEPVAESVAVPVPVASPVAALPAEAEPPQAPSPEPMPAPAGEAGVPAVSDAAVAPAEAVPPPPDATGGDPTDKSLWPDGVSPETKAAAPDAAVAARIADVIPKAGYLAKPAAALTAFLAAPTWQERLKYTLAPDKMRPLMEAYYKKAKDGPIVPEAVEFSRAVPTEADPKRRYYAFVVFAPGVEGAIPVSVEDTPKGCLVEWRSFVEGHDKLLENFYAGYRAEPDEFRVLLRRTHYFEKDVPAQDQKLVFEIQPPTTNCAFYAWLDKSSNAYGKHFSGSDRAGWDATSLVVVRLQWVREESGVEWVRMTDIVAEDWHPDSLPAKR